MDNWLVATILALLIYGLWGFFPKLAVTYISPQSALVYEVLGAMLVGILALGLVKFRPDIHPKGILFAVLTGIAGMAGTLFFFIAVQKGKVSVVVSMTALYPLITILLAVLILHEPLTAKQITGMAFALSAIYLLAS
ncbi:MAG: EamA family transporter [Proteobacteria bacterium]|nr:EamA family transporter [Pseudomonadota bacterium]MBU1709489.1 EamA family transporter [Pseudomonadota bacterium]